MIKDLLTLGDTVELMNSKDYRDRFVAEYIQTSFRYEKLRAFNTRIETMEDYDHGEVEHDCPLELLKEQQRVMGELLHILEIRAVIEDIDLADAIASLVRQHKKPCCVTHDSKCDKGIYGVPTNRESEKYI